MRWRSAWVALSLAFCVSAALAQGEIDKVKEATAGAAKDAAGATAAEAEMMAKWQAHATPGDAHKALDGMVGKWTVATKWWAAPGAPSMDSKGSADATWIMGGRFVQQNYTGDMMGQPFTGLGYTGYDNTAKVYVSSWMDSMSTSLMVTTGTYDAAKKEMTFKGEYSDPISGKPKASRSVLRVVSPDQHVYEMYEAGPDGKEFKTLELTYNRAK